MRLLLTLLLTGCASSNLRGEVMATGDGLVSELARAGTDGAFVTSELLRARHVCLRVSGVARRLEEMRHGQH